MDIIVKSKNCDVPAKLKQEAVSRLEHATRFYDRLVGVEMVFSEEHNPRIAEAAVVEVTARTKRHHIRARAACEDHRRAVDAAVGRFERQLAEYKARLVDRAQRPRRTPVPTTDDQPPDTGSADAGPPSPAPRIVRRKTFDLTPMLPEDAAWQLELLGHDFFLFSNAASGRCGVVYRRRDGDFGLIEAGS